MRLSAWLLVAVLAITPAVSGETSASRATGTGQASPFQDDPRFKVPVTLAAREEPLLEFLARFRRIHHLPVRADARTESERVTVFCRERPSGEILAAIARHLDYTWIPETRNSRTGYVLTQTQEQWLRERSLRAALLAQRLAALQRKVGERLEEARRSPEERRRLRLARLQRELETTGDADHRRQLEKSIADIEAGSDALWMRDGGLEAFEAIITLLGPRDWERIWAGEPLRFAYPGSPKRIALAEGQAAAMVRTAVEWLRQRTDDQGRTIGHGEFAGVDRVRGVLHLSLGVGEALLLLSADYVGRQPKFRVASHIGHSEWSGLSRWDEDAADPVVDPGDAGLRREVVIPPLPQDQDGTRDGERSEWLVDVVETLAPRAPFTLIGDSYDDEPSGEAILRGRRRLDDWLREGGRWLGVRIRRQGETLFFRHRDWPLLRPTEVPVRLQRRWEAVLDREGTLPLRTLAEIASRLSDYQVETLVDRWTQGSALPVENDLFLEENLTGATPQLRLLAALTPAQWSRAQRARPGRGPVFVRLEGSRQLAALTDSLPWREGPDEGSVTRHYEGPGWPTPDRPLDARLRDEELLESGAARPCLSVAVGIVPRYRGGHDSHLFSERRDALENERALRPKDREHPVVTVRLREVTVSLHPFPGARATCSRLFSFPADPRPRIGGAHKDR